MQVVTPKIKIKVLTTKKQNRVLQEEEIANPQWKPLWWCTQVWFLCFKFSLKPLNFFLQHRNWHKEKLSNFEICNSWMIQFILFEIDCTIFYTNLHELFFQFISWTNWVNSGKFMDNWWISCQVMAVTTIIQCNVRWGS